MTNGGGAEGEPLPARVTLTGAAEARARPPVSPAGACGAAITMVARMVNPCRARAHKCSKMYQDLTTNRSWLGCRRLPLHVHPCHGPACGLAHNRTVPCSVAPKGEQYYPTRLDCAATIRKQVLASSWAAVRGGCCWCVATSWAQHTSQHIRITRPAEAGGKEVLALDVLLVRAAAHPP